MENCTMENLENKVAESLTRFYIVALFVVAILTLSGLFLIRKTINSLNHDTRVVNLAGRQRMLSQRLTKLAILQNQHISSKDSASFESSLKIWGNSHNQLENSVVEVDGQRVIWKSIKLDSMFHELRPVFETLHSALQLNHNKNTSLKEQEVALNLILDNETNYLSKMDEIVYQFDKESFSRLKNLERIEWILDILTILVLIAEGFLIFRPVVNTTKRVVRMLTESEEKLKFANRKLFESSRELVDAEKNIQKLREAQFQSHMEEERIRALALVEGQEQERKRFAMELHDGIGQMLTGLKLHAELLQGIQFYEEKYQKRFDQLVNFIQEIIQTTRQISFNLMPSVLSDFGIGSALRVLCEQMKISSGQDIQFQVSEDIPKMNGNTEIGLYRIAQESITNAVKHANAKTIIVSLKSKDQKVMLTIADNGQGFVIEPPKNKSQYVLSNNGLENIKTRTRLLNGEFEIKSDSKNGTKIMISINL